MKQDHLDTARNVLWLQWIAANAVGWMVGVFVVGIIVSLFGRTFALNTWWSTGPTGLFVGFAQWRVLAPYRPLHRLGWIGATALGMGLGQVAAQSSVFLLPDLARASNVNLAAALVFGLTVGLLFGLTIGAAQWVLLRDPAWIGLNLIGWGGAILITGLLAPPTMSALPRLLSGFAAAILSSAITGLWLRRLLE